ncbi:hypothetical protein BGZ47_002144 [Haplosporangium gracile]|nr:hypothetical protein BGZ47_002144 [Haplosporangium gracile]
MTTPYRLAKQMILNSMVFDLWLVTKSPWWFRIRSPMIRKVQMMIIAKEIGKRTQFEFSGSYWPKILTVASAAVGLAMVLAQ